MRRQRDYSKESTEELPAITESTPVKLKASTIFKVGAALVPMLSTFVGLVVWLNTMHEDVKQLKADSAQLRNDVHEIRTWLMPEHHQQTLKESQDDHRISSTSPTH